jgi:hypothetical protein
LSLPLLVFVLVLAVAGFVVASLVVIPAGDLLLSLSVFAVSPSAAKAPGTARACFPSSPIPPKPNKTKRINVPIHYRQSVLIEIERKGDRIHPLHLKHLD